MIEAILRSKIKPKEIQQQLVDSILSAKISIHDFMAYFQSAKDKDKGTCADVMKHISIENPGLLAPYIELLIQYINYPLSRVKWGVPEAIGNMAKAYPTEMEKAIPLLLKNITDEEINTTVIRWCAAYGLTEIAKYNQNSRALLLSVFQECIQTEANNGIRNLYLKALKLIKKEKRQDS